MRICLYSIQIKFRDQQKKSYPISGRNLMLSDEEGQRFYVEKETSFAFVAAIRAIQPP
jgi:hypothetical protein